MKTWAFLFKSDVCNAADNYMVMEYPDRKLIVCGVQNEEEGIATAKRLRDEEGCWLLELCGGFGADGARRMADAVKGLTIGYVDYHPAMRQKMEEGMRQP